MTDYQCGHSQELLILDDNPLSMIVYLEWKDTVGRDGTKEQCFDCYCSSFDSTSTNHSNKMVKK
jgi:hypothetical protein